MAVSFQAAQPPQDLFTPLLGFGSHHRGRFPQPERQAPEPERGSPEDADRRREPGKGRVAEMSRRFNHEQHNAIVMPLPMRLRDSMAAAI